MFDWKWRVGARVLTWGVVIGLLWAVIVAVICVVLYCGVLGIDHISHPDAYLNVTPGTDDDSGMFEFIACVIAAVLVCWFAPRGFLVGALCGFYAPASSLNPLRCAFLWRVVRSTVQLEGAGFLVSALSCGLLATSLGFVGPICGFLLLELICFGLALWSALNRALREEKAHVSRVIAAGFGSLEGSG